MPSDEIIGSLKDSIVKGDKEESVALTKKAIESGLDTKVILNNGLIQATQIVGTLFEKMEYYLPDLIISADAMIGVMEIIKPHLEGDPNQKSMGTILLGSAEGDVHSIGKNLMISLLQGQGYKVIDLGTDVPPDKFVEEAKKSKPDVIGISGLLTASISTMQKTVLMLKEENIPSKIIVGGGILTAESCTMIGADDFATDGWDGLKKINKLVERAE